MKLNWKSPYSTLCTILTLKKGTRPRFMLNAINIMSFQKVDKSEILEHVQVVPKLFLVLIVVF